MKNAHKILRDVKPENYFRVCSGAELASLEEFLDALKTMSEDAFKHHVKDGKNDFSDWVRDVIKDDELADALIHATTREETMQIVRKRLYVIKDHLSRNCPHHNMFCNIREFMVGAGIGLFLGLILAKVLM